MVRKQCVNDHKGTSKGHDCSNSCVDDVSKQTLN